MLTIIFPQSQSHSNSNPWAHICKWRSDVAQAAAAASEIEDSLAKEMEDVLHMATENVNDTELKEPLKQSDSVIMNTCYARRPTFGMRVRQRRNDAT
jgi:hypothetical protein